MLQIKVEFGTWTAQPNNDNVFICFEASHVCMYIHIYIYVHTPYSKYPLFVRGIFGETWFSMANTSVFSRGSTSYPKGKRLFGVGCIYIYIYVYIHI